MRPDRDLVAHEDADLPRELPQRFVAMSTVASRNLNPRGNFDDFADFDEQRPLSAEESKTAWIVFACLTAAILIAYENMLRFTATFWAKDMYSHGYIIPFFAAYLFWIRKRPLTDAPPLERWIGVGIVAASLGLRVFAAYYDYNNFERLSFIGALLGVCLLVGGRSMIRWAWLPIAFLLFMYPLPSVVENTLLMRLQTLASIFSTWTLQLLGVAASRQGNTIHVDTLKDALEVAEACSGLRMLTIFGAMSVALAMIIDRPWWDKLIILLSAIPIALASNVIRIVLTALLNIAFGQDTPWLNQIVHDWAGLAMMPIGLGLLWIELAILSRLTIPIDADDFVPYGRAMA
ncbi:Transmembrane exosortase (Exosortase_EpsH) [Lacipirellula limnantheis]|uniref:Transmembrane exosortase (Exosortase_EpsH) n=2 Tax=Lacipirellula limnantheis TaxID=2528024 RepID=A0A517TSB1_9BACT|nr:Transmembrane exosortase (Exosortase_EpsH) [Lacipirellula limnantheis]